MNLEVGPSFLCCWANLPHTTRIRKQACVKHKSVSNINNHGVPIGLTASDRKRSSILNFLEQGLNRLTGVILCVDSLVVLGEFCGINHSIVY
jgi:hypothetical protein